MVEEEDLLQAQLVGGGTFDLEDFYILDQDVPRQGLGRNVKVIRVVVGQSTSWGGLYFPSHGRPWGEKIQ